jgi:sugar phosphate isomerase/epimerase
MKPSRRELLQTSLAAAAGLRLSAKTPEAFKLGIIADEITQNLDEALDFIQHYNLHYCELREAWSKNVMNWSQEELDRAKSLIAAHGMQVSDIASPIFKWNLPEMPSKATETRDEFNAKFTEQDADRVLEQSFKLARFFGTRKVRIFSYWRVADPEKAYPMMRDRLAKAAKTAKQNDIILVLENEHSCNVGTGKELGRLLKDINSPALRGNWDAGNAAMLDEVPFPDGYEAVKGLFAHVHIKDVRRNSMTGKKEWAPVGGGIIDWKGQMQAFRRDGYDGTMSLETHYLRADKNKVESTRESLDGLLKLV